MVSNYSNIFLVMNFKQFVKENRTVIIFSSLMIAGLIILPQFGHASVLEDMKSELKYDFMPLEREPQVGNDQFLDEDQSMVCKHLKHLGTSDSNELVCITVQDKYMDYEIFEELMIQKDTYPLN